MGGGAQPERRAGPFRNGFGMVSEWFRKNFPALFLYLIIGNTVDSSIYAEKCGESRINTIVLNV